MTTLQQLADRLDTTPDALSPLVDQLVAIDGADQVLIHPDHAVDGDPALEVTEDAAETIADQVRSAAAAGVHDHLLDEVRDAAAALEDAAVRRDDVIRRALAHGAGATAVADAAGLARSRIYQIRDRTR